MKNAFVWAIVGLAAGLMSWFGWSQVQPYDDGIVTTGTVIREIESRSSDGDNMYKPEVEFRTVAGETIIFSGNSASSARVEVGSTVDVSYRPEDPRSARNLDASGQFLIPIGFGISAACLLASFAQLRKAVGRGRRHDLSSEGTGAIVGTSHSAPPLPPPARLISSKRATSLTDGKIEATSFGTVEFVESADGRLVPRNQL